MQQSTHRQRVVWQLTFVEAVGPLAEDCVAAQLKQLALRKRVEWRLISAVGPTAEDCVAAGLGVVYSLKESQTAAPIKKI